MEIGYYINKECFAIIIIQINTYKENRMNLEKKNFFKEEIEIGKIKFANRICINPMEGSDGNLDGTPSALTKRRYERFSKGGASLIWFEAIAICEYARASKYQLYLSENNKQYFKLLIDDIKKNSPVLTGVKVIAQLTHSGRFSRPYGFAQPLIGCHDPFLDEKYKISPDAEIVTDNYLDSLPIHFERSVKIAKEIGFDGVDIKACHRYLISELLAAHTRKGKYGGSFENRIRLINNIFDSIQKYSDDKFILASRIGIYDAIDYPYGFGVNKDNKQIPDFNEPLKLINILESKGLKLVNVTMGTPYYNPYVNKPSKSDFCTPEESIERLLTGAAHIKKNSNVKVVSTGYSYLREQAYDSGNKMLLEGNTDFIAFGRLAFAYPDFAQDILNDGKLNASKCCVSCNKCSELLRKGEPTGCVLRDSNIYLPKYLEAFDRNKINNTKENFLIG